MVERTTRQQSLPKPSSYLAERVETVQTAIGKDTRPIFIGDPYEASRKKKGGWVGFVLPEEQLKVSLKLPYRGNPHQARQEWLVRHAAQANAGRGGFDVHPVVSHWNAGIDPKLGVGPDGRVRLSGQRTVGWDHMADAIEVWASCGQRGIYPPDLAAMIDPERRLPFLTPPTPDHTPPQNRWVDVAVDLMAPLDDQLKAIRERLKRLRCYVFMVAGRRPSRSGAREVGRDVLVYTLHYSAGQTVSEVAKIVFPKERKAPAEAKVKKRLTAVRKAIQRGGI